MGILQDLQTQRDTLNAQIAVLQAFPEDIYSFGTVAVFSSGPASKWRYIKVGEEQWKEIGGSGDVKQLREFALEAHNVPVGYFEVYIMTTAPSPVYVHEV